MLKTRDTRPPLGPEEAVALERAAAGSPLSRDEAARLSALGLIWRTSWGKFALSRAGVAALRIVRGTD